MDAPMSQRHRSCRPYPAKDSRYAVFLLVWIDRLWNTLFHRIRMDGLSWRSPRFRCSAPSDALPGIGSRGVHRGTGNFEIGILIARNRLFFRPGSPNASRLAGSDQAETARRSRPHKRTWNKTRAARLSETEPSRLPLPPRDPETRPLTALCR